MTGLAIDASGDVLSAALATPEGSFYAEIDAGIRHSERLMQLVDSLFASAGAAPGDLEFVACMRGPGSFTGLRLGMSAAKGMSVALGIPLYAAPTLDCAALPFGYWKGTVVAAIDAKKGRWFAAPYRAGERLAEAADVDTAALAAIAGADPFLCGSSAEAAAEAIRSETGLRPPCESFCRRGRARELLSIAAARFSAKDPGENDEVGLHYLRKSEAELTREAAGRAP